MLKQHLGSTWSCRSCGTLWDAPDGLSPGDMGDQGHGTEASSHAGTRAMTHTCFASTRGGRVFLCTSSTSAKSCPAPRSKGRPRQETSCSLSVWGLTSPLGQLPLLGQFSDYNPSVHEACTSLCTWKCCISQLHLSAVTELMEGSSRHLGKKAGHPALTQILWAPRAERIWDGSCGTTQFWAWSCIRQDTFSTANVLWHTRGVQRDARNSLKVSLCIKIFL